MGDWGYKHKTDENFIWRYGDDQVDPQTGRLYHYRLLSHRPDAVNRDGTSGTYVMVRSDGQKFYMPVGRFQREMGILR